MASRMALANELSGDIATAILTVRELSPQQLDELKEIVLQVHLILQEMAEKERIWFHRRLSKESPTTEK